jgi:hypothetical protein
MKWIKTRKIFLNEAKIKDLILPRQASRVWDKWGEKYLDYEEIEPTSNIKQGQWKLTTEDKNEVLGAFFGTEGNPIDMEEIFNIFKNLDKHFSNTLLMSIDMELLSDKNQIIMNGFNPNKPTIDQITILFEAVFRKISINDTRANNIIKKDSNGRPIKDEEGNMLRVEKEIGETIFDSNLVSIAGFIESYNKSYKDLGIEGVSEIDKDIFYDDDLQRIINISGENHNSDYKFDFEIFDKDIYLKIVHNPKDILNMSISKFYSSCQHLYSGMYSGKVLSNVFDPNSMPAFLYFDSDIYWGNEKISDFLPLSRMLIRNVENEDNELKIFFDRTYPDRCADIMKEMVEKYTENKQTLLSTDDETYIFSPDIDIHDDLELGYHDRFGNVRKVKMIGKNTKKIILSKNYDWSDLVISPNSNIKEIVIETELIPTDLFNVRINPNWIKFKFIKINTIMNFDNIKTNSFSFEKCKFSSNILTELNSINPDIKKLQIVSCDMDPEINFKIFEKLEELHLIYTLSSLEELDSFNINELKELKKLVISGDLVSGKEGKEYLSMLKKSGKKIEIIGPVI